MAGQGFWDSKIPTERVLHAVVQQADARDAAILMLLYAEGLSVVEVSALDLCDLSLEDQLVTARAAGKEKHVRLPVALLDVLHDWLDQRGKTPGPLFLAGSPEEVRRLSASAIRAMVTRRSKWDGVIVERHVDETGRVRCYDQNGRLCWDMTSRERVVLVEDLRRYAPGLHVGQLGWTVPDTCDGYKWVEVEFDNGVRLPVLTYGLERVLPERAQSISDEVIAKNRGTMHDADPVVTEQQRTQHVYSTYSAYVAAGNVLRLGSGPEELYAFTFPSLRELAALKGEEFYPIKVGYTRDSAGAIARVAQMMNWPRDDSSLPEAFQATRGPSAFITLGMKSIATVGEGMGESPWVERAGFPERAELLLICGTLSGRELEVAVHRRLREMGRQIETAVGKEWFRTNAQELANICMMFRNE